MQKAISEFLIQQAEKQIDPEMLERINRLPVHAINEKGFDEFGFHPDFLKVVAPLGEFFYRKWFRVETSGVANIPQEGPALIIANHSGQIPIDGMMIAITTMMELEEPRLPRAMIEKWFPTLPHVGMLLARAGQIPGVMEKCGKAAR